MSNETTSNNTEDDDTEMQSCIENQKECNKTHEETEQCVSAKPENKLGSKDESCDSEVLAEHTAVSNPVEEKDNVEMHDLSQTITEKLKFLSEGRESISAVQTMQIQLQVCVSIHYNIYLLYYYLLLQIYIYIALHYLSYVYYYVYTFNAELSNILAYLNTKLN